MEEAEAEAEEVSCDHLDLDLHHHQVRYEADDQSKSKKTFSFPIFTGRPGQAGRGRATIPPQPLDARSRMSFLLKVKVILMLSFPGQHSNVTTLTERMREFEGLSGSSPETTQAASSDLSTTNPSGPLFYGSRF